MISQMAQLLVLLTQVPAEPDPKQLTADQPIYRSRCSECDDEGRDARLPCEGHN